MARPKIYKLTISEVEYVAFSLAKKLMEYSEPIPLFDTRYPMTEMETILKAKLLKKVATPGFVLFKDAVFFNIGDADTPSATTTDSNLATITLKGTIHGILFNEQKPSIWEW